jgi:AAHS family benzoate transporter-like MFS transporter
LGGALMGLELPFQYNFMAFAIPGAIGGLAVCFISVKYSYEKKAQLQQQEIVNLETIVLKN